MCIFERHLKKGSVFISTNDESVYLVNGIIDSWEDMLSGVPTPIIVDAVLLPFNLDSRKRDDNIIGNPIK